MKINHPLKLLLFASLFLGLKHASAQTFALNDSSNIHIDGPHRFVTINNITGLQVTSLHTNAWLETSALSSDEGSISMWMSPLEDIDKSHSVQGPLVYPLIANKPQTVNDNSTQISIFYQGTGYPLLIARFNDGSFWGQMDYGLSPFVYAESLKLFKGQWYHIVVNWNKKQNMLNMFINGELVGHNFSAKSFAHAGNKLFVGNPLMVMSNVSFDNEMLSEHEISKAYNSLRPASNQTSDSAIQSVVRPVDNGAAAKLDNSWKKVYSCDFN